MFCIQAGARRTCPVRKLKLTPTPSHHAAGTAGRRREISCSCFGDPRATYTTSGLTSVRRWAISATSLGLRSNPTRGQNVPAICKVGLRWRSTSAAPCAVPGAPPRRKTDRPRNAAAAVRLEIKFDPAMRCGNGVPCKRLAQTSGMPSATTSSASATSALKYKSFMHRRR